MTEFDLPSEFPVGALPDSRPSEDDNRRTVRAAVLREVPGYPQVEKVALDARLAPHEVLVKVAACGLCHSDLHMLLGEFPVRLPAVPGHEVAGVVEEVGEGVTSVSVGDHIVACLSVFCGSCIECREGRSWLCERRYDLGRVDRSRPRLVTADSEQPIDQVAGIGGLAERTVLHENSVVAVPSELPAEQAALLGCAVLTGVGSVTNGAKVQPGETVVVLGCGGVGLNVIQGARIAGASRIVAVDIQADKLELARRLGATDVVDASNDPVSEVLRILEGGAHHVFDVVGRATTVAQGLEMVRAGRTVWIVGIPPMGEDLVLPGLPLVTRAKGVQGLLMGANHFPRDIPFLADLVLQGRLDLESLVSAKVSLDEVAAGFDQMKNGVPGRVVVMMS